MLVCEDYILVREDYILVRQDYILVLGEYIIVRKGLCLPAKTMAGLGTWAPPGAATATGGGLPPPSEKAQLQQPRGGVTPGANVSQKAKQASQHALV